MPVRNCIIKLKAIVFVVLINEIRASRGPQFNVMFVGNCTILYINVELFSDPGNKTQYKCGMKNCKSKSLNIKLADMINYPPVKKEL